MSDPSSPVKKSKNIYIGIGAVIVIVAIAAIALVPGIAPVDVDAMIENRDCEAAGQLTEAQLENIPIEKQIKVSFLIAGCLLGGSGEEPEKDMMQQEAEKEVIPTPEIIKEEPPKPKTTNVEFDEGSISSIVTDKLLYEPGDIIMLTIHIDDPKPGLLYLAIVTDYGGVSIINTEIGINSSSNTVTQNIELPLYYEYQELGINVRLSYNDEFKRGPDITIKPVENIVMTVNTDRESYVQSENIKVEIQVTPQMSIPLTVYTCGGENTYYTELNGTKKIVQIAENCKSSETFNDEKSDFEILVESGVADSVSKTVLVDNRRALLNATIINKENSICSLAEDYLLKLQIQTEPPIANAPIIIEMKTVELSGSLVTFIPDKYYYLYDNTDSNGLLEIDINPHKYIQSVNFYYLTISSSHTDDPTVFRYHIFDSEQGSTCKRQNG